MRHLITFLLCSLALQSYAKVSKEACYDSLQNINQNNYTQLVGQTLYYPSGEIIVSNLFWSNKKGSIYKPRDVYAGYVMGYYSLNDAVLNKHFIIEKVISGSHSLLKTRIRENNDVVYINLEALFRSTQYPVMFVDGYIQKCRERFLKKALYMDKRKHGFSLPASHYIANSKLASIFCSSVNVTTKQNYGGVLFLSDRTSPSSPADINVLDYLRAKVSENEADEIIRQAKIRLEIEAREEAERKRIQDSIAVAKMQEQQQEDSLALVRMKEKYMHKTWYYSLREWQYIRFEPIEVIDIQVHRNSTGNVSFPMKLKYKNTGELASHDAVIFSDGKCTFDMCFHNIPPEKEYPTVKHWKAIKDLKLVLGMNKQEAQLVWGIPADINTSKGSWGIHEQWVYPSLFGGRSRYLYFKNGRLSAIQE